jgi:hypothetical protein
VKRRAFQILVFLLLGAIVNVAVAWGFMMRGRYGTVAGYAMSKSGAPPIPFQQSLRAFFHDDGERIRQYGFYGTESLGRGIREFRQTRWTYNLGGEDRGDFLVERECGWPMFALSGECHTIDRMEWGLRLPAEWRGKPQPSAMTVSGTTFITYPRGWSFSGKPSAPEFLPLRPIWPGFAINTAFYAGVLWLLFAAPFALRRWRRIMRGLCLNCGYDLRGAAADASGCPECGATR